MVKVRKGIGIALIEARIKDQKQEEIKNKKKLCGKDKDMNGIAL
jgi:hypothetical protein